MLDDVQDTWTRELAEAGADYRRAKLVLFTNSITSGCGYGSAQTGPFYCPADQRVYIDLSFYDELRRRLARAAGYAGVWAHSAERRNLLEIGDIDEAMRAASAIGDDRLQRMSRGTVSPDSFTHGTSAQRVRWFRRGYQSGDPDGCDTFGAAQL